MKKARSATKNLLSTTRNLLSAIKSLNNFEKVGSAIKNILFMKLHWISGNE